MNNYLKFHNELTKSYKNKVIEQKIERTKERYLKG